jgi:hypothetical protein
MLYGQKTIESQITLAQPENVNFIEPAASTQDTSGTVHAMLGQAGVTVVDLRAEVVQGKVALWLQSGESEVSVGELDTLEITGPPDATEVELRVADITSGGAVAYKVVGLNEAGCTLGEWPRDDAGTGIKCVLAMPPGSTQVNWIKFTIAAEPQQGQATPTPLDPLGVVKKEG